MRPELVIFDVDGLMLDTEARWQEAWQKAGEEYGIDNLGTTTFLKCVGRSGKVVEDIVYQDLSYLENPYAVLDKARSYGIQLLDERIDPKPGIYELLDLLDGLGIKKAVATATTRELTLKRLTELKLIDYFDYLLCGDEVTLRKPNPEIYNKVIDHFKIEPRKALVLEDSVVGVEAAYKANIPCIMVPDLIAPSDKQKHETIAIVSSLHDIIGLFE